MEYIAKRCGQFNKKATITMIMATAVLFVMIMYTKDTWNDRTRTASVNFQTSAQEALKLTFKFNKWIVVTSISLPTQDIQKLAAIEGWQLLVVGDEKTPKNWSYHGCIYLGLREQHALGYRILEHIPLGSYTRKNIGYLYAIQHGAQFIYDTDDDNHPVDNLSRFKTNPYRTGIIHDSIDSQVMNPYAHFGQPTIWPRGYPLDIVGEPSKNSYVSCQFKTPPIQQGLVNGDPDVDAIFRLTRKRAGRDLNITFDSHAPPVTLPPGVFAPYNSQNTFHSYRALWALLLPKTVAFRVTDIWRGYWAQRLLWLIGEVISFHPPNAFQKRNAHSYLKDFVDEEEVYEDSGKFIQFLSAWDCVFPMTFFHCVSNLSHEMAAQGFWKWQDAELTDAWLADLVELGYILPKFVNYQLDTRPDICLNQNQSHNVLFHPVRQNTSTLEPNPPNDNPTSPKFPTISSKCQLNSTSTLLNRLPSFTFSNILLIIVFNFPHLVSVTLTDELYFSHFPNIIYCSYINSSEWSFLHKSDINNPDSGSRRLSFINATNSRGYHGYECAIRAIEMGYEVDGYFVVGDDVLFNYWKWRSLSYSQVLLEGGNYRTRSRYSNETSWTWWNSVRLGKIPVNAFLDELSEISLLHSSSKMAESNLDSIVAIRQYIRNRYAKNFNMTTVSRVLSDIYFIPSIAANIFYHVASIARKHNIFLEIAVPTVLDGLSPTHWVSMAGISLWSGDRYSSPMKHFDPKKTYLHPVKLSILLQDANFTQAFCELYVSELLRNW